MTAIDGLDRLEGPARWRAAADAPARDVFVSVGEAELVILSPDDAVLAHWSLPGMRRLAGDADAVRYAPGDAADEMLEVEEPELVAALERVRAADRRPRRRGRWLRAGLAMAGVAAIAAGVAAFGPDLLRDRAAAMMTQTQRVEVGNAVARAVAEVSGPPCTNILGLEALDVLRVRLFPDAPVRLRVLPDMPMPALALPGGLLLLSNAAILAHDDPAIAAGHLVAARAASGGSLDRFLGDVGPIAAIRLLTGAPVPLAATEDHARDLLAEPPTPENVGGAFAAANVDPGPWSAATGVAVDDDGRGRPPPLDDTDWQSLREICAA